MSLFTTLRDKKESVVPNSLYIQTTNEAEAEDTKPTEPTTPEKPEAK